MVLKKNTEKNKGFSLIEVVIAVAVLTILLAPIVAQIAQTLKTSATAKERQYSVENAEYVLNVVQKTPMSSLASVSVETSTSEDKEKVQFTMYRNTFASSENVSCKAVVYGSNYASVDDYYSTKKPLGVTAGATPALIAPTEYTVAYNASAYSLNTVKLGRQNKYQRSVVVDNLRTKLMDQSCVIETNFSDNEIKLLEAKNYTITTEGAAVKYTKFKKSTGEKLADNYADNDYYELVTEIVCAYVPGIKNPNGAGTSYMQDLDTSKVAIIQGVASNFDEQAELDLYSLKMNRLKKENPAAWEQAMTTKTGTDILSTALYVDNVSKMTKISIVSGYDEKPYYDVDCTVYYEDYLKNSASPEIPELLTYSAYHKRFYTNQAPDIYFVYEPYIADGSRYSQNDYILTYDGVLYGEGEKRSKLYIIKPDVGRVVQTGDSYTTTLGGLSEKKVNIYLDYIDSAATPKNGPMQIYTNIDLENFQYNNTISDNRKKGVQYAGNKDKYLAVAQSGNETSHPTGNVSIANLSRKNYPLVYKYDEDEYKDIFHTTSYNNDVINLFRNPGASAIRIERLQTVRDVLNDRMVSDRIYTVTVQLDQLDSANKVVEGYSVKLTGAKGAD